MERRQQPRKTLQVKVYFICVSADGRESAQDIGVVCDISPGGMMLETTTPVNTRVIRIFASTARKEQIEATGGVIYSMEIGNGRYSTGIFFEGDPEETAKFVEQIMRACDAG